MYFRKSVIRKSESNVTEEKQVYRVNTSLRFGGLQSSEGKTCLREALGKLAGI